MRLQDLPTVVLVVVLVLVLVVVLVVLVVLDVVCRDISHNLDSKRHSTLLTVVVGCVVVVV